MMWQSQHTEVTEEEVYLYISEEFYIDNFIPVLEGLFYLRKYSSKIISPRAYHPELDISNILKDKGEILHRSYMGILC